MVSHSTASSKAYPTQSNSQWCSGFRGQHDFRSIGSTKNHTLDRCKSACCVKLFKFVVVNKWTSARVSRSLDRQSKEWCDCGLVTFPCTYVSLVPGACLLACQKFLSLPRHVIAWYPTKTGSRSDPSRLMAQLHSVRNTDFGSARRWKPQYARLQGCVPCLLVIGKYLACQKFQNQERINSPLLRHHDMELLSANKYPQRDSSVFDLTSVLHCVGSTADIRMRLPRIIASQNPFLSMIVPDQKQSVIDQTQITASFEYKKHI